MIVHGFHAHFVLCRYYDSPSSADLMSIQLPYEYTIEVSTHRKLPPCQHQVWNPAQPYCFNFLLMAKQMSHPLLLLW